MDNKKLSMISFVIPCYCCALTIEAVVREIEETMNNRYPYEIILINDNSTDNTLDIIRSLCASNKYIKGINFTRNFGQHSAIMAGYRYIKGDIIISLDDDGQTPANESLKLIEPLVYDNYDIAIAKYVHKKHSIFKNLGSKLNDLMARFLIDKPKELYSSSFFSAKRFIVEEMIKYKNPYPYLQGLILRTSLNIVNVEVSHRARMTGKSNYTFKKLVGLWLNGFTAFSVKPLRAGSIVGFALSVVGFFYAIYVVILKLTNPTESLGWSSLMAVQLIIGGTILGVLGLIGEYIGRIYICLNSSPQYVIKELINLESEVDGDAI